MSETKYWTPAQVGKHLGKHQTTIHDWGKRYKSELSKKASQRPRLYTEEDVAIFEFVRNLVDNQGISHDDVLPMLKSKKREWENDGIAHTFPQERFELAIDSIPTELLQQFNDMARTIYELEVRLEDTTSDKLQLEEENKALRNQLRDTELALSALQGETKHASQERIIELEKKIAVLEYMLENKS